MAQDSPSQPSPKTVSRSDCLSAIVFLVVLGWTVSIAYTRHFITFAFTIDPTPRVRWFSMVGGLVQIALLALPLLPLSFLWPNRRYRAIFQTWGLAMGLVLLFLPVHLPDPIAAQTQAVLHILFSAIFCALILFLSRMRTRRQVTNSASIDESVDLVTRDDYTKEEIQLSRRQRNANLWLFALLVASISAYPWLAWGALGSFLDTLLQLTFTMLFGLAAALLLELFTFQPLRQNPGSPWGDYFLSALGAGTSLLVMTSATAFGFSGIQIQLMMIMPGLGWILSGLKPLEPRDRSQKPGWKSAMGGILPLAGLIGLVAAAPMTLIDPDEMVLVASASAGEILGKAYQAAVISSSVILAFGLLLFLTLVYQRSRPQINFKPSRRHSWTSAFLTVSTLAALGIAVMIYFTTGQPGFYGERMFVILKDQADVSAAPEMTDYNARRQYVYDTMTQHAETTQVDLRRWLDRFGFSYTPYYLVNALEVNNNPLLRLFLLAQPEVDRIIESPHMRPLPAQPPISTGWGEAPVESQWNLTMIGADRVWKEFDVTGEGIVIGQSDSGAQGDHPELVESYRGKNGDYDYNWFDPWNGTRAPIDILGHGTHTLGSILGKSTGVAPGATWYACVNLARNLGNPAHYLDCMQFMLAPFPLEGDPFSAGDPTRGAHVINNSWGCPEIEGCDPGTFLQAVRALRSAGVFVITSAGNDGPACDTLNTPPPIYEEVFSVGAIDRSGDLASFSSIGPVTSDGSGRVKPDILAPGVNVLSAYPEGTYSRVSGTSMAGPHVVGVVALLWSANPDLIGDIDLTEQIIIQTAQSYTGYIPDCPGANVIPSTAFGYGIVDAYAAVIMALGR